MKISKVTLLVIFLIASFLTGKAQNTQGIVDTTSKYTINLIQNRIFGSTEDVLIGYIATFIVDNQNRVFIADGGKVTIRVFDSSGKFVTSIGCEGRGPGEFAKILATTKMKIHSNRLYITDSKTNFIQRLQVYNLKDWSFHRTINLIPENQESYKALKANVPVRFYPRADGTFLVAYHLTPHLRRKPNTFLLDDGYIRYVVQDDHGNILTEPILTQIDQTYLAHPVKGRAYYTALQAFPFFEKSLFTVSTEGKLFAVNHTSEFKITIYDSKGNKIRSFRYPFDNRPLTREGLIERYDHTMEYLGPGNIAGKMIRKAESLPEAWPAIQNMLLDDKNQLWVATIIDEDSVYRWWVIDPSGTVVTKFNWPRNKPIKVVKNEHIYTLETDPETGLEGVVRYRIELTPS